MTIHTHINTRTATQVSDARVAPGSAKTSLIGRGLNGLQRIAPEFAGNVVEHLFFTPRRLPVPTRYEHLFEEADAYTQLWAGNQRIPVYSWGFGPTVLMVHGWSGSGIQFGAFIGPLVKAGYRVVVYDAPAHGRAEGLQTNLLEMSEAVERVAGSFGPLKAIVAHSIGSLAAARALVDGVESEQTFLLAPPRDLASVVAGFGQLLGLSDKLIAGQRGRMERRFGEGVWQQFSFDGMAAELSGQALIIADQDDTQIPPEQSRRVREQWTGSEIFQTQGLGHFRLLWHPTVVERVFGQLLRK
ncbi:alpha/beta hydrolase [Marinobacter salinexigens]|uniref:Alpha/beta hydrolase n=1 Tax=Marinobacter salinexigens TaxID=2919747 RepID=A0A5B0VQV6_9GAMM|nr:alpha/beta hydrolase [Marinobacter salinexigens]KAA1176179.1 alpha/beta hydrolase [Marinobacter salinexigens]